MMDMMSQDNTGHFKVKTENSATIQKRLFGYFPKQKFPLLELPFKMKSNIK